MYHHNNTGSTVESHMMNILHKFTVCVTQKESYSGFEQHEGVKWQNFHFLVNCSFKTTWTGANGEMDEE